MNKQPILKGNPFNIINSIELKIEIIIIYCDFDNMLHIREHWTYAIFIYKVIPIE